MPASRLSRGAIDFELPGRPRQCKRSPRLRRGVRRRRRDRLRAQAIARAESFDLVLDLSRTPWFAQHQPPQGYFRAGRRSARAGARPRRARRAGRRVREAAVLPLQATLCAHGRSGITGLHAMHRRVLDAGDPRRRRPHRGRAAPVRGLRRLRDGLPVGRHDLRLSVGARPRRALRRCLSTYATAGGKDACMLLHAEEGREAIARAARGAASGLPARVIPLEVLHIASVGIDLVARGDRCGASQVVVLATGDEAPQYRARCVQMPIARDDPAARSATRASISAWSMAPTDLWSACGRAAGAGAARAATFALHAREAHDARLSRFDHLASTRRCRSDVIPLPSGPPFGAHQGQQGRLHAVHGVHRRVPGSARSLDTRGAAAALHRDELRAVRHLRGDLPRGRDHARAAADLTPGARRRRAC